MLVATQFDSTSFVSGAQTTSASLPSSQQMSSSTAISSSSNDNREQTDEGGWTTVLAAKKGLDSEKAKSVTVKISSTQRSGKSAFCSATKSLGNSPRAMDDSSVDRYGALFSTEVNTAGKNKAGGHTVRPRGPKPISGTSSEPSKLRASVATATPTRTLVAGTRASPVEVDTQSFPQAPLTIVEHTATPASPPAPRTSAPTPIIPMTPSVCKATKVAVPILHLSTILVKKVEASESQRRLANKDFSVAHMLPRSLFKAPTKPTKSYANIAVSPPSSQSIPASTAAPAGTFFMFLRLPGNLAVLAGQSRTLNDISGPPNPSTTFFTSSTH
jgi:hypothetical protein